MHLREYFRRSNWYGSFYELAMEFHPTGNDARLLAALQARWSDPALHGPLASPYSWPEEQTTLLSVPPASVSALGAVPRVQLPEALDPVGPGGLYGLLRLADGTELGITCAIVREEGGSDWLDFCIPTGMLGVAFPVDYPLFASTNPWLAGVDHALLEQASTIHAAQPFDLALIGEEVSGQRDAGRVTATDVARGGYLLPAGLLQRLHPEVPSVRLCSDLHWFPYTD